MSSGSHLTLAQPHKKSKNNPNDLNFFSTCTYYGHASTITKIISNLSQNSLFYPLTELVEILKMAKFASYDFTGCGLCLLGLHIGAYLVMVLRAPIGGNHSTQIATENSILHKVWRHSIQILQLARSLQ
jgi:hypothetical protein